MTFFRLRATHQELTHAVPGLGVWATWSPRRGLAVLGHHLVRGDRSPWGFDAEYEYGVTLTRRETRRLTKALGLRGPWQLVPELAGRGPEVVARGEQTWLRDHLGPDATRLWTHLNPLS